MPRTREEVERAVAEFDEWANNLDFDDPNVTVSDPADLRAIGQALAAASRDELAIREAVAIARVNGRSWARIGMVLGVSKQAAQKRYGNVTLPQQASDPETVRRGKHFEVYEDRAGKFRFRLVDGHGTVVAVGEAYETKDAAIRGCEAVQRAAEGAKLVEC